MKFIQKEKYEEMCKLFYIFLSEGVTQESITKAKNLLNVDKYKYNSDGLYEIDAMLSIGDYILRWYDTDSAIQREWVEVRLSYYEDGEEVFHLTSNPANTY